MNEEETKSNVINAKKLIINYIDSLVNRVDIYTEEMLEKFSKTDTLQIESQEEKKRVYSDQFQFPFNDKYEFGFDLDSCDMSEFPFLPPHLNFEIEPTSQFDESEPILVWDYLNKTRDEMINSTRLKKKHSSKSRLSRMIRDKTIHAKM